MNAFDHKRILALDVHPKSFGFAIFEGMELLDWGARSFPASVHVPAGPKIRGLIADNLPEVLVLKDPGRGRSAHMVSAVKHAARAHRIALHPLPAQAVRQVFANCANKNQIASVICERFAELLPLLPPPRKNWMTEDYRMQIFQAVATGIAYISRAQDT